MAAASAEPAMDESRSELAPLAELEPTPPEVDLPPPPPCHQQVVSVRTKFPEGRYYSWLEKKMRREERQVAEDDDDSQLSCGGWCEYVLMVVLSSLLLLASLVLVLFWTLYYREGFAWSEDPQRQFNLHPVLMIAGFIFFSGFSMLLYRISRCCRRIYVKLLHTVFHALAIPCIVLGFLAVLDHHNLSDPPIPNFYSVHSWMGLITMGLFAIQFVVGFFSFLLLLCCDNATSGFRASLVPLHATFGLTTFVMAVATALTGLTQAAFFKFGADYSLWPQEAIIINALAMILVALVILISYAVRREALRVKPLSYLSERL